MKTLISILTILMMTALAAGAFAQDQTGQIDDPSGDLNGEPQETPQIDNRQEGNGTQEQWGPPTGGGIIPLIPLDEDIVFIDMDGDGICDYESQKKQGARTGVNNEMLTGDAGDSAMKQRGKAADGSADEKVFGEDNPDTGDQTGDQINERRDHGPGGFDTDPIGPLENQGDETFGVENDDMGTRDRTGAGNGRK